MSLSLDKTVDALRLGPKCHLQDTSSPLPSFLFQAWTSQETFRLTKLHTVLIFIYLLNIYIFEDFVDIAKTCCTFIFIFIEEDTSSHTKQAFIEKTFI